MPAFTEDALHLLAVATYREGPEWNPLPDHLSSKGPEIQKLIKTGRLSFYEDGLELWHSYRSFYDKVLDASETAVQSDKHLGKFWTLLLTFTEAADLPVTLTRHGLLDALDNFSFHVTAQHDQMGSISDSMETPLHGDSRTLSGLPCSDLRHFGPLRSSLSLKFIGRQMRRSSIGSLCSST